jgi:hypothetical protein
VAKKDGVAAETSPCYPEASSHLSRCSFRPLLRGHTRAFDAEIPRLAPFEKAAAEGVPVYDGKGGLQHSRACNASETVGKEIANYFRQRLRQLGQMNVCFRNGGF